MACESAAPGFASSTTGAPWASDEIGGSVYCSSSSSTNASSISVASTALRISKYTAEEEVQK